MLVLLAGNLSGITALEVAARCLAAVAVLAGTCSANACLWDTDTLGEEARGLPTLLNAIVGRVEVNPPLYYEMRLKKATQRFLAGDPNLGIFDDCAVACDRLGRGELALRWLEAKEDALRRRGGKEEGDDWYRLYANRGTVRAHNWARKPNEGDTTLLRQGIADLERCLEINPDGPFGRERAQVSILRSMLADAESKGEYEIRETLGEGLTFGRRNPKTIEALVGIVSLGSGPENPDLVTLLAMATSHTDGNLRAIARFRFDDLVRSGKTARISRYWEANAYTKAGVSRPESLRSSYLDLKRNAEGFRRHREKFMLARLRQGRHPDWDESVWDGYVPTPRADPDSTLGVFPWVYRVISPTRSSFQFFGWLIALAGLLFLLVRGLAQRRALRSRD
ncbi:MAG: hypothetical protein IT207_06680 [Fimbriimonadaceae bacterium]|nr:hypothetical protein [Fimbriimonadaceae bacterium]